MRAWKPTPAGRLQGGKSLGCLELLESDGFFEIVELPSRIVFGGACNVGFLESGYIVKDSFESTDETLQALAEDLDTYYRDGKEFCTRIVCNERM